MQSDTNHMTEDKESIFSKTGVLMGWIWLTKGGFWRTEMISHRGIIKVCFDDKQVAINFIMKNGGFSNQ